MGGGEDLIGVGNGEERKYLEVRFMLGGFIDI